MYLVYWVLDKRSNTSITMKLLESSQLNELSRALCVDRGDVKVVARYDSIVGSLSPLISWFSAPTYLSFIYFMWRIESYSCKMVGDEKHKYKRFYSSSGTQPGDLEALGCSPNNDPRYGRRLVKHLTKCWNFILVFSYLEWRIDLTLNVPSSISWENNQI